jgi:phosphoribosylformylglycinamidine synthase
MKKPKVLVLTGFGLNCEKESFYSWELAGAQPEYIHINELIRGDEIGSKKTLEEFEILHIIGGFAHADDHGAGVLLANQFKYRLGNQLEDFIKDGKLILSICNGFQAAVNLGLLPGFNENYSSREVALAYNDIGNFRNIWTHLTVNKESPCIFTKGIERAEFVNRHGEGKFYAPSEVIKKLFENNQVVLQYAQADGSLANGKYPYNPNGSLEDIAGICDPTGKIFGLMPHPEAYNNWTNHPQWTRLKERLKREGKDYPSEGAGIQIFRNAVNYSQEKLV